MNEKTVTLSILTITLIYVHCPFCEITGRYVDLKVPLYHKLTFTIFRRITVKNIILISYVSYVIKNKMSTMVVKCVKIKLITEITSISNKPTHRESL